MEVEEKEVYNFEAYLLNFLALSVKDQHVLFDQVPYNLDLTILGSFASA